MRSLLKKRTSLAKTGDGCKPRAGGRVVLKILKCKLFETLCELAWQWDAVRLILES